MPIVGDLDVLCNTPSEARTRNSFSNSKRGVERFHTKPPHDGQVCIVGGGPSLADCLEELRWRQSIGQEIWATNNTFAWLMERGITPKAHVFLDARPENAAFVVPTQGVKYYVNNNCDTAIFDGLSECHVVMYDMSSEGTGTTVGLKALYIAGFSGFRNFHLFGFDSSYRGEKHHAYEQALNDAENRVQVTVEGETFTCAPWMLIQAEEFQQIAASFAEQGCVITVSGDGLLPFVARRIARLVRSVTAVYDLAACPPTYDFISFLGEAERHRIAIGAEVIDIVFMPGPADGFRDDDLPDSVESRVGMLYRVCIGACRLVPSVRNIEVLKVRQKVDGADIFPVGYQDNPLIQHYGCGFFRSAMPVLRATKVAKAYVARGRKRRYVTITLRESSHWPARNSNRAEWSRVAEYIEKLGYEVALVPDIESPDANAFSWDVDLRLALYEGAVLNLGVNNGPMCMLFYADVPYIIFKMVTDGIPWCMPEFFERIGMHEGAHGSGRIIWGPDEADKIIAEFHKFVGLKEAA